MHIDLSRFRNKSKCQKGNRRVLKMLEVKDPAIKLFGKTIPLPDNQIPVLPEEKSDPEYQVPVEPEEKDACRETKETEEEEGATTEECRNQEKPSSNDGKEGKHQAPTDEEEKATMDSDHEEDQADTDVATQEKILKKPDKLLPCPRCNSLDTKFCYFNNYNVNQPRHFCKNCQRYWTAGGTMRNVPVGAGRRKNKNSVLHHRQLMMSSDAMLSTRTNHSDSANHQISTGGELPSLSKPLKESGKVLKFGPDAPLCDSMASVLSLGEQKRNVEAEKVAGAENGEEPSRNSSMAVSTSQENVAQIIQNRTPECCDGPTPMHPLQCYPGPPWAFQWNHGWNNVAPMAAGRCSSDLVYRQDGSNPSLVQWAASPMVAAPSFCLPNIPFPYMAAPYWGCMPNWPASAWNNTPWLGSNGSLSSSSSTSNSGCSGNGSPTLGKHSRDASVLGEEKLEKSLWVPKTLRIDDPDEAAKSSIWATLGIKQDENGPRTKGGIFKAFQPKMEKQVASDATNVLQANPAALSRSQTFQEST